MNAGRWARRLNLFWIAIYTLGLGAARRHTRRDEVRSEMHDEVEYGLSMGDGAWALERQIASRTVRGVVGDILWRLEAGRDDESVAERGGSPPLPWFSTIFLGGVITCGALSTVDVVGATDFQNMGGIFAVVGAALTMLGLYLVTHRWAGPFLIAIGTVVMAWSLWWTFVAPVAAVAVGIAGVRRSQRIERLLGVD